MQEDIMHKSTTFKDTFWIKIQETLGMGAAALQKAMQVMKPQRRKKVSAWQEIDRCD